MGAGALKSYLTRGIFDPVDEQPIRLDMAFAVALELAQEGVVAEPWGELGLLDEPPGHEAQLGQVLAAPLRQPRVLMEPRRMNRSQAHSPRLRKKASLLSKRLTPTPRLLSRSALRVAALGVRSMAISKGRALASLTWW